MRMREESCDPTSSQVAQTREKGELFEHVEQAIRHIVEFCCSPDSLMGLPTVESRGCRVVRITEADDVTTEEGLAKALHAALLPLCLLWASIPCTGGCPWQRVNAHIPGVAAKIRRHIELFKRI